MSFNRVYSFRLNARYTWNSPLPAPALDPINVDISIILLLKVGYYEHEQSLP